MICQHEIITIISSQIPGFADHEFPTQTSLRPYSALSQFAHFTRDAVNNRNRSLARKCFHLADLMYRDGDAGVKQLIDNYFIYSFSGYRPSPESDEVRSLIPPELYRIYVKEMINNHC